jgi:quercetin dioxygenase-like cupin family protein
MVKIYTKSDQQEVMSAPLAFKCMNDRNIEIVLISLKKGEKIPIHNNPFEVIFFVKSGKGVLTVEEESYTLEENESALISDTDNRSWVNNEQKVLELLVIKMLERNSII